MSKITTRDMVLAAMFAALAAVAALLVQFGSGLVPFSLVPFVVLLAGGVLGARLGALSMAVYVFMGLVGLPVFEKPPFGGPAYVLQPTFGFLIGYIAAAYVAGWISGTERLEAGPVRYVLGMVTGVVVLYLLGLPYLYVIANFYLGKTLTVPQVLAVGFLPFIGMDLVKAVVAAFLARAIRRRLSTAG